MKVGDKVRRSKSYINRIDAYVDGVYFGPKNDIGVVIEINNFIKVRFPGSIEVSFMYIDDIEIVEDKPNEEGSMNVGDYVEFTVRGKVTSTKPLFVDNLPVYKYESMTVLNPTEPTGVGAVVLDENNTLFIKATIDNKPWRSINGDWVDYNEIKVKRILQQGIGV